MILSKTQFTALLATAGTLLFSACSPVPLHQLSTEEKTADMYWIYSQFDQNYAPLELKEAKYGFAFEDLKKKYLEDAVATKNNDEFYNLMFRFVTEFRDAHTSASLTQSDLPGRSQVAYLGFSGKRRVDVETKITGDTTEDIKTDALEVTDLLPTIDAAKSMYPIEVGDLITKLNGVPLRDIVLKDMVKYRNVGQDEANLTYHMNKIFNRSSIQNGLPKEEYAVLTIKRSVKTGPREMEVKMPWVIKDLVTFTSEQAAAKKAEKTPANTSDSKAKKTAETHAIFDTFSKLIAGDITFIPSLLENIAPARPAYGFLKQFRFVDDNPTWTSPEVKEAAAEAAHYMGLDAANAIHADALSDFADARNMPDDSIQISSAKNFPTYIHTEMLQDDKGKNILPGKLIAYMYLEAFDAKDEDAAIAELNTTLQTLQANGVKDLVIDMINNGGGSLNLGMRMAQTLSRKKVQMPDMQLRVSDTWVDEFDQESRQGPSDIDRSSAQKLHDILKAGLGGTKRLSENVSAESLLPALLLPNYDLTEDFNVVLLTNEMCASMCDIFAAIMHDNGLARIVGGKTMGAGGNVVDHYYSPNAHLILRQTESLIVRRGGKADGQYIENNGIEPDFPMPMNESDAVDSKFDNIRKKAVEVLLGKTTDDDTSNSAKTDPKKTSSTGAKSAKPAIIQSDL